MPHSLYFVSNTIRTTHMAAEWVLDEDQVLGYVLYQVCTLTLAFTAAVFSKYTEIKVH